MYGLPDSAILGTAKRLKRGIVGKQIKRREWTRFESGSEELIGKWLDKREAKARAKRQQKRLERKHKVKFS